MSVTVTSSIVVFPSQLGWMAAAFQDEKLTDLTFGQSNPRQARAELECEGEIEEASNQQQKLIDRLQAYAEGASDDFRDVPVQFDHLTDFQRRVFSHCRRIPYGKTLTYAELATRAGSPRAARAVGNVMASNRLPLIIPCHRVVGAAGSLGGYSASQGTRMKLRLLEQEGAGFRPVRAR